MARTGTSTCRILGIDPGLETTGYGAIELRGRDAAVVEAGTIQTDPKAPLAERLSRLQADLAALLAELKPDLAAVEKLYAHYKHPRTAILMGHARGVILLACSQAAVRVRDFPATMVKRALTGNGHASKQQVQRAVQVVCGLREIPEPPDVADALAIALCAGKQSTDYTDYTDRTKEEKA
jgi:crossover junction endodeoxyribonuclease RuvC